MPFRFFLERIRRMIPIADGDGFKEISAGFEGGTLKQPHTPMTDGELAAALREFTAGDRKESGIAKLMSRFRAPI